MRGRLVLASCIAGLAGALVLTLTLRAGPLNPPTGPVASTTPSLADVLGAVQGGAAVAPPPVGDFVPAQGGDAYTRFDGVVGNSADSNHPGWVDTLNFGIGVDQDSAGRVRYSNAVGVFKFDNSFGPLLEILSRGAPIASVDFDLFDIANGRSEVLIRLSNCRILSLVPNGGSYSAEISYDVIEFTFQLFDSSGMPAGTFRFGYDRRSGMPI